MQRQLKDLLCSSEGKDFLASQRILVNQDDFVAQLSRPINSSLATYLGYKSDHLVYAAQQTYSDCTQSMLDRISILADLDQQAGLVPFFIWVDTDRAGSDPLIVKFYWSLAGNKKSVRLVPRAAEDMEPRFISLERSQIQQTMDTLTNYLVQTVEKSKRVQAKEKLAPLKFLFLQNSSGTLSALNHQLAYFVLNHQADFNPFSVMCSEIISQNIIIDEIDLFLNHLDEAIQVFNETVCTLIQQGIDPQVRTISEDYLPLHYSCPVDHRRLKLYRQTKGTETFAVTTCRKCGQTYQFYLGGKHLTMAEIQRTGRWSPDVCLLLFLNDLVSGYVGGKSSTIYYGLVMKAVLEKVFQKPRVPILVPPPAEMEGLNGPVDGLIYQYLTAV